MRYFRYVIENKDSKGFFLESNKVNEINFSLLKDAYLFDSKDSAERVLGKLNEKYYFNLEVRKVRISYELA